MRSVVLIPASLALLLAPSVAFATAGFPGDIQSDLSLTYAPPCTVCHETDSGGSGTVTRAFGKAMRAQGLQPDNSASVQSSLDGLAKDKTDSDCDGVDDIQQLKDGRDPNTGEFIDGSGKPKPEVDAGCSGTGGGSSDDDPRYGCGAQVVAAPLPDATLPLVATVATVVGLALSRRRRRA
jgi:hypothetical protein